MKKSVTTGPWSVAPGNFIVDRRNHIVAEVPCQGANDRDVAYIAALPDLHYCVLAFVNRFSNAAEDDEPINGADAVEWISAHSAQFRAALRRIRHPRKAKP